MNPQTDEKVRPASPFEEWSCQARTATPLTLRKSQFPTFFPFSLLFNFAAFLRQAKDARPLLAETQRKPQSNAETTQGLGTNQRLPPARCIRRISFRRREIRAPRFTSRGPARPPLERVLLHQACHPTDCTCPPPPANGITSNTSRRTGRPARPRFFSGSQDVVSRDQKFAMSQRRPNVRAVGGPLPGRDRQKFPCVSSLTRNPALRARAPRPAAPPVSSR